MTMRAAVSPVVNELKTQVVYFALATAVVMSAMLNGPAVFAQQNASQANIPFAFSADHQVFPAGVYRAVMHGDHDLKLVNWDTGVSAGIVVRSTRKFNVAAKNSLIFFHDDRGYRLQSVRFAHGNLQSEATVRPRLEREVANAAAEVITEVGMN